MVRLRPSAVVITMNMAKDKIKPITKATISSIKVTPRWREKTLGRFMESPPG
jgi:hypothetical protein